jgi:hypothetical protein
MTIRVLVATARLQGRYPHDHFGTTAGELVRFASYDPHVPSPGDYLFTGLDTHLTTSTALVVDLDMTREQYIAAWANSYLRGCGNADGADRGAEQILEIFADWPPGTVVEVDRGTVSEREPQPRPGPRETDTGGHLR